VQLLAGAGAVLLQREVPEAVNTQVAAAAAAAGVPVLLDAGGVDAALSDALLRHLTTISPNETELPRLTGQPTETEAQVLAAAAALQDKAAAAQLATQPPPRMQSGPQQQDHQQQQQQHSSQLCVLLKRGSAGSMMVGPGGQLQAVQPAIAAKQVVDTTGERIWCATAWVG
jgi:ribokinase